MESTFKVLEGHFLNQLLFPVAESHSRRLSEIEGLLEDV